MGNTSLNLMEIRAFVAVARAGSVQAASSRLALTQSAVSRLVQRLEIDLGVKLFDRAAKPLVLTSDGRTALEFGLRVMSSADQMVAAISTPAPSGKLRLGTAHALAGCLVGRPLDLLRAAFPDVTLQLSVDWAQPLVKKVEGDVLDAAFLTLITDASPGTDLPARFLREEAVHVVGAARHRSDRSVPLATLNEIGWAIQPEGCGYRTALDRATGIAGLAPPKIVVETLAKDTQLAVVGRGAAFCLLPASQADAVASDHRYAIIRCSDLTMTASTWFVRKSCADRFARALDVLEGCLKDMLRSQADIEENELLMTEAAE